MIKWIWGSYENEIIDLRISNSSELIVGFEFENWGEVYHHLNSFGCDDRKNIICTQKKKFRGKNGGLGSIGHRYASFGATIFEPKRKCGGS